MAIAFVKSTTSTPDADQSTSVAAPAQNHASGNLIVVAVYGADPEGASPTVSSVSDTAGNTYYRASYQRGANYCLEIWYAFNITGNANNVVTVNYSTSVYYRIVQPHEYSGVMTSGDPFDVQNVGVGTGTAMATAAATTNYANELIFAAFNINQVPTFTAGSGFTLRQNASVQQTEDDTDSGNTGAYNASMTSGTSGGWAGCHATFRPRIGGGSSSPAGSLQLNTGSLGRKLTLARNPSGQLRSALCLAGLKRKERNGVEDSDCWRRIPGSFLYHRGPGMSKPLSHY